MNRPTSVIDSDQDALRKLIDIHAPHTNSNLKILDVTYNVGRMWAGVPYTPHRMDINPKYELDTVGSFLALGSSGFGSGSGSGSNPGSGSGPNPGSGSGPNPGSGPSFDVIVFDPPHVTEAGSGSAYVDTYGTRSEGFSANTESISALFAPFLVGARAILNPNGIILAKIADQVHRGRYRWQHVDFINTAIRTGFTACDLMIKVRPYGLIDPKWKNVYHVRSVHTYWIVLRKGTSCIRKTPPLRD